MNFFDKSIQQLFKYFFWTMLMLSLPAFTQQIDTIEGVQAVLGEDGRFLNGPIEIENARSIGLTIEQATDMYGTPSQLFTVRGEEAWQDDVVFFYAEYIYLYWFQNRVWQLRFDHRYTGTVAGLKMGLPRNEVRSVLGYPHYTGSDNLFYDIRDMGFPMRLRLVFVDDLLHDVYLYRSDF